MRDGVARSAPDFPIPEMSFTDMRNQAKAMMLAAAMLIGAGSCTSAATTMRESPACETSPAWKVDLHRSQIALIFDPMEVDSAHNAARGLPYATGSNVVLVASDPVCAAVLSAHNTLAEGLKIDGRALRSAMVFDLGGTGYALVARRKAQLIMFDEDLSFVLAWAL